MLPFIFAPASEGIGFSAGSGFVEVHLERLWKNRTLASSRLNSRGVEFVHAVSEEVRRSSGASFSEAAGESVYFMAV